MEALKKIEEILGIKLEKERYGDDHHPDQKNTYYIEKDYISSLKLDGVTLYDLSELLPYLEKLRHFDINNSSVLNFSDLLQLNVYYLTINHVAFKNNDCDTIGRLPGRLIISNTTLDASCFNCCKESNLLGIRQVEFYNCHIDNIQELDNLVSVSSLILDEITFTHQQPKKTAKGTTGSLTINNTKFKDISFLPFKNSLIGIEFTYCQIETLVGLVELPNFKCLKIDTHTTIKDQSIIESTSTKKITCIIEQEEKSLDLRNIRSLKNHIEHLQLGNYKEKTIDFIKEFKEITQLSFYHQSKVYIDAFLPIANQIETISFTSSSIVKYSCFKHFKNLIHFESKNYEEDNKGLRSFKKIYPLRNQLKTLAICEFQEIEHASLIEEFRALETLKIECEIPTQTAKHILTLKKLKQLYLSVEEDKYPLNLQQLTQLEFLNLDGQAKFIGFEYLTQLKSLKIGEFIKMPAVDINELPKMESLTRLNFVSYGYEVKGLEQFPNLEALKIKGSPKIKLGRLEHLKVLDLENSGIEDFSTFEALPKLEKLDLSSFQSTLDITGLKKFPNLKYLSLLESEVNDITHLEPLKKLEFLDLYYTDITDIKVLNSLPNLKEVNIATGATNPLEEQLDNPEIAFYCGRPAIFLCIWREDEFGI